MEFEKINLDTWQRAPLYTYFMENMRNVMSMTAEADATRVFRRAEADGLKVYPALTWLVTKTVNSIENFRYALAEDGSLIRWKSLSPYFAHFHKEDGNFIKLVCDYDEDVFAFCARFDRLREETKDKNGSNVSLRRRTPLTLPACRGRITSPLTCTFSTRADTLRPSCPGAGRRSGTDGWFCPFPATYITPSRTAATSASSLRGYRKKSINSEKNGAPQGRRFVRQAN